MAKISVPTPLRPYADSNAVVEVSGATVGEALRDLVTQYPELDTHLYNEGKLRSFVNVFLGEEDIKYLDGEATEIDAATKLRIIPSIAGGLS